MPVFEEFRGTGVAILILAMLMRVSLTTLALLIATAASAQTPSFSRTDYATSPAPRGIVAADFNRDGAIDVALANTGRDSVSVLINQTGSGQGFVQTYDIVLGGGPFDIAAADVNHDNVLDLVVANADLNTIDLVLGRANGGFDTPVHIPAAGNPRGLAVYDLNWDGHDDIIYTQFTLGRVQILNGDGRGNFTARLAALAVGSEPQGVVVGDFQRCCRPDIAVANSGASVLTLYMQTDLDVFQRVDIAGPRQLNVLTTADFNRDGKVDIAAASTARNSVSLYYSDSAGLLYAGDITVGSSPRGIAIGDVNGDGRADVVTANRGSNTATILPGRVDGWFSGAITVPAGVGSRDVAVVDFNGDGQTDVATANEFANSVTVLTNSTRPSASLFWEARELPASGTFDPFIEVADFNGNSVRDILRAGGVLLDGTTNVPLNSGASGARSVFDGVTGDFNGDGRLDVARITGYFNSQTNTRRIAAELYRGDGAGAFQFAGAFGTFGHTTDAHAGDVNGDGRPDLAVTDTSTTGTGRVHVLLATADGFVQSATIQLSLRAFGLALEDVNRDGKPDLIAAEGFPSGAIEVFHGDGSGNFTLAHFLSAPGSVFSVFVVDLNRDGLLDLVGGTDSGVAVWTASASGAFAGPTTHDPAANAAAVVLADFTGDGSLDAFTGDGRLLRGRGDGTFAEAEHFNIDWHAARAVDYDRDGRIDVVLVNFHRTMVLINRATRGANLPPVADAGPAMTFTYDAQFDGERNEDCGHNFGASWDPNLDDLTFEWRDHTGRIFSTFAVPCWPILNPGTYTFTLIVRDGHGGESTDTLPITVHAGKEMVRHVADNADPHGGWQFAEDPTAAGFGFRLWHPNANASKITTALAAPTHYVETSILADPTQTYKLWVRLKAENDYWGNDSIFVQFGEGAVVANGTTRYRIGTTDALDINLEQCSGCGIAGWGWRDERWGAALNSTPVMLRFPQGGWQRVRIQTREDGVSIDQIVLSSEQYLSKPPGPAKNDNTILAPRPSPGG